MQNTDCLDYLLSMAGTTYLRLWGAGSAWQIVHTWPEPRGGGPWRYRCCQKKKKTYRKGCAERKDDYCSRCAKQRLQTRAESWGRKGKEELGWAEAVKLKKKKNARITAAKQVRKIAAPRVEGYLKALPALANFLLKWFSWVICRCSWKIKICRFWAVGGVVPDRIIEKELANQI